jgi:hypothetical protein
VWGGVGWGGGGGYYCQFHAKSTFNEKINHFEVGLNKLTVTLTTTEELILSNETVEAVAA